MYLKLWLDVMLINNEALFTLAAGGGAMLSGTLLQKFSIR